MKEEEAPKHERYITLKEREEIESRKRKKHDEITM